MTAGTAEQTQSVINACVFPKLIYLLGSSEFDIQVRKKKNAHEIRQSAEADRNVYKLEKET